MEEELVQSVEQDPMAAYDLNVEEEGLAIREFLALLESQEAAAA
jgi:hypothetical protein